MGLEINSVSDIKDILDVFKDCSKVDLEIPGVIRLSVDNTLVRAKTLEKEPIKQIEKDEKEKNEQLTPEEVIKMFQGTTEEFNLS